VLLQRAQRLLSLLSETYMGLPQSWLDSTHALHELHMKVGRTGTQLRGDVISGNMQPQWTHQQEPGLRSGHRSIINSTLNPPTALNFPLVRHLKVI
jgi:hypothetical protein